MCSPEPRRSRRLAVVSTAVAPEPVPEAGPRAKKLRVQEAIDKKADQTEATGPSRAGDQVKAETSQTSASSSRAKTRKRKVKVKVEDEASGSANDADTRLQRQSKSRAKSGRVLSSQPTLSEAEMHAFDGNDHWVGAHMSIAKGIENAVSSARLYGSQAFALFLKAKMNWTYKPLAEENIQRFRECLPQNGYDGRRCLPHGSYLINLGNPDPEKYAKSFDSFMDDLRRCAQLGIGLYNFHPGSGVGDCTKSEACSSIARSINSAHEMLRAEGLASPIILLENMAGQGNQVGGRFEDLADIIQRVANKTLVGVCIDTAHVFAAGCDIRTRQGFEAMIKRFDEVVGLRYLKAMHLNDSKAELGSYKDRHENLGGGHIGLVPFWCIMNDSRFRHMPLTLETPAASWKVWQGEIKALYALQGLPGDRTTWRETEDSLAALRALKPEMEKDNSLAEGAKAAKKAMGEHRAGTAITVEREQRPAKDRGHRGKAKAKAKKGTGG